LHVPKAFGKEVTGSNPVFSTSKKIKNHFMYSVYIIYSQKLDKYYVGHTSDIEKRLIDHNTGVSTYTSKSSDWVLKYTKQFENRALAKEEEMRIKKKKSRKYIVWLIESN
jgi:putative endonuclease